MLNYATCVGTEDGDGGTADQMENGAILCAPSECNYYASAV